MDVSNQRWPEGLKEAVGFHGHLCPGLVMGYRVVEAAKGRGMGLEAGDEEVVALAENGSCALDAIQVLTGCTLGKGNLRVLDHGKMSFTFWERRTNRGLRIKIRPQAMKRARDLADSEQETKMQRLCELILEIPDEELFSFEEVHSQPPEPARVEPSVACQRCGELVMGSRLQHYRGVGLCIPCLREVKGG